MDQQNVILQVKDIVKLQLSEESTGHDFHHVIAVARNALLIQEREGGDKFVIELAALLHDIADSKFNNGDHSVGAQKAKEILADLDVEQDIIDHVASIIENLSFSAKSGKLATIEGQIVQDSDRLEALGALGIARCFAYGGKKGSLIYDPQNPKGDHSIGHFYYKLLKLKEMFNTKTGAELAVQRDRFLRDFLEQFLAEWEGRDFV